MPTKDNLLRLIVAEDSVNDAERLIGVLRNQGLAVRPTQVSNGEELQESLSTQAQDLVLCAPALGELPLEGALRELGQSGKDIPLLVLNETEDPELRAEVMALGAVDLVSKAEETHFSLAVQRELHNLQERRRVRRLEAQLRDSERRCQTLLESSRDAIAYVHDGMHVFANPTYLERFGYTGMEDLEGLPVLDLVASGDQARFKEFLRARASGQEGENEIQVGIPDAEGNARPVLMRFSPATWDGEPCTQILLQWHGEHGELEEQLASLANKDAHTGLFNRPFFVEHLNRAISQILGDEDGVQMGLLYIQPDNLKAVSNNVGINAVDQVITDVAGIVSAHLGEEDVAARYTDTAVTVLLPQRSVQEALSIAETIRSDVEQHISEVGNRTITKSCSIGAAVVSDAVSNAQQAIDVGYEACELARSEGGNRVHLHSGDAQEQGEGIDWRTRLRDALAGDDFRLRYQPIIALFGDQVERYEVRLGLVDDTDQWIAPDKFLPQADRLGLTPEVDLWVARKTVEALARRLGNGVETRAFVKVSAATLGSKRFLEETATALRTTGLPGRLVIFQVSEPVAVTQLNEAKDFFKSIKELDCGFSIEDFGSGLNPFQLVRHLPAEYLKLDRSLIDDLATNGETRERVGQIIHSAHEMQRKVIAGYLEEATVLATLWQHQVDLVHGHFLAEPAPEMNYDFSAMII